MPKPSATPDFLFSLDALIQISGQKRNFIQRDAVAFADFGVNQLSITSLQNKIDALANYPTDDELTGDQVTATQEKDALAEQVRNAIRLIMTRVINQFGEDSGKYRKFGTKGLVQMTDFALSKCARTVERSATSLLAELADTGLTANQITALDTLRHTFDLAIEKQEDTISDRDIASEERISLANSLYADLVKLCNTGKSIWATTNEAKYNDYVLYNTPGSSPEPTTPPA